jgi:hypothetical protein
MDKKIFWCEATGTVYWRDGDVDEVMFAPMNNDNTCDLDGSGVVETWEEVSLELKAEILSKI